MACGSNHLRAKLERDDLGIRGLRALIPSERAVTGVGTDFEYCIPRSGLAIISRVFLEEKILVKV